MLLRKKQVGDYLLCESIGEGQRSLVRSALHLPTQEKVVIKFYEKVNDGGEQWRQLRSEVRQLSMLQHDHVLMLLEAMETEHGYYLVFEEATNGRLDQLSPSMLNTEFLCRIFMEILDVISFLHKRGFMWGNLKLSSCFLDRSYSVKVKGLRHCSALGGAADSPSSLVSQIKKAVDVWSLGAILLRLVTNKLGPQGAAGRPQKSLQGTDFFIPSAISKDLEDLLRRMLDSNPVTRITVPDIYRHTWCHTHTAPSGPLLVHADRPLASDLVREVAQRFGVSDEAVRASVLGCRADHLAATYVLLRRRVLQGRGLPAAPGPHAGAASPELPSEIPPAPSPCDFEPPPPPRAAPPAPSVPSGPSESPKDFRSCLHQLREKARAQRVRFSACSEPRPPNSASGLASERSIVLSRLTTGFGEASNSCDSPITMPSAYPSLANTPSPTASRRLFAMNGGRAGTSSCIMCRTEDTPQLLRQKKAALRLASRNPTELYTSLSRRYGSRFIKDPNKIRAVELFSRQMMMDNDESGRRAMLQEGTQESLMLGLRTPPPPPNSRLQTRGSRRSSVVSREPSAGPHGNPLTLQEYPSKPPVDLNRRLFARQLTVLHSQEPKTEASEALKRSNTTRDLKLPPTRTFQWTHRRAVNVL